MFDVSIFIVPDYIYVCQIEALLQSVRFVQAVRQVQAPRPSMRVRIQLYRTNRVRDEVQRMSVL